MSVLELRPFLSSMKMYATKPDTMDVIINPLQQRNAVTHREEIASTSAPREKTREMLRSRHFCSDTSLMVMIVRDQQLDSRASGVNRTNMPHTHASDIDTWCRIC
jgi:hypothetical protein